MSELTIDRVDIVPAVTFLTYETNPDAAILYDDPATKATIRGIDARAYLLGGLYEEYAETLEFHKEPPLYSRIGMIILDPGDALLNEYQRQCAEEIEDHRKEFGDVLWYSAALLRCAGLSLWDATKLNSFAEVDGQAADFSTSSPIESYRQAFGAYARSAAGVLLHGNEGGVQDMASDLGELLRVIAGIAQHRLDTTLNDIAQGNIQKVISRRNRGVIFGSGDRR